MSPAALRLTSTSFLLPGNAAWRSLGARRDLDFGLYGDWPAALLETKGCPLAWVLFLEDIIDAATLTFETEPGTVLAPILAALDVRLANVTGVPTVVAWSAWRQDSPIRNARTRSPWTRISRALEDALYNRAENAPALLLVNLDNVFAAVGADSCFDPRNWYAAHCRLSRRGLELTAQALDTILVRREKAAKKVLVLDCDNTLWGGVVGEVGVAGLTLGQDGLGQAFVDFQRAVAALVDQGLILCLASKNNASAVWEVFDNHPSMVLKRDHVVSSRIDWNDKADNVISLAAELNLGLSSFVFWDDNPLERESMRHLVPNVLTLEPPVDVAQWPRMLATLNEFASFVVTREDQGKVDQYKSVSAFAAEQRQSSDRISFLHSIQLRPAVVEIIPACLPRAAQLCFKTNQFNLRTVRHDETGLDNLIRKPDTVAFLAQLTDRFGDHGLIGLAVAVATLDAEVAFLDTFLLSCRVLGRSLDAWMLDQLVRRLRDKGKHWLVVEYRPTPANIVAKEFATTHGLEPLSELSSVERERVKAACAAYFGADSQVFVAKLPNFSPPNLEPFIHVEPQALPA